MALVVLAEYSGPVSATHEIPISGAAAGRDLLLISSVAATPSGPGGAWEQVASVLFGNSSHAMRAWRLRAADNPTPLTSVTLGLPSARKLDAVLIEDDIDWATAYIDLDSGAGPGSGGAAWGSGLHTFSPRLTALAVFAGGTLTSTSTAPIAAPQVTGNDRGFTMLADSGGNDAAGGAFDNEAARVLVLQKPLVGWAGDGVTVDLSPAAGPEWRGTTGIVAYDSPSGGATEFKGLAAKAAPPSGTGANTDTASVNLGLEFYVTDEGCTLTQISFWQAGSGTISSAARTVALFNAATGAQVGASQSLPVVGSGWQDAVLTAPIPLTANTRYRAAVLHPGGRYTATPGFFSTGPGGGAEIANGPLRLCTAATATSGHQGSFNYAGALAFPNGSFGAGNYWTDVTVATASSEAEGEGTASGGVGWAGTAAGDNGEAGPETHSIFGAASPGALTWHTDATPSPGRTGNTFYRWGVEALTEGWGCVGGRLWVSAAALAANTGATLYAFLGGLYNSGTTPLTTGMNGAPLRQGAVSFAGLGGVPGWVEVTWDHLPVAYTERVGIYVVYDTVTTGYQYHVPASSGVTLAADGSRICMASSSEGRSLYKAGNNAATILEGPSPLLGVDILMGPAAAVTEGEGTADGGVAWAGSAVGENHQLLSIAEENALTAGVATAGEWTISGAGDTANVGFPREYSTNAGGTVEFSCSGTGTVLDIYRIGWYGGAGWRKVTTLTVAATIQPEPATIPDSNGGTTCEAWTVNASWQVPANATSGFYVGVYRNAALNNASHIPFIIRNDDLETDLVYKTSETTYAVAYNHYRGPAAPLTGGSFYGASDSMGGGGITTRAHASTYNRPVVSRAGAPLTAWLNAEYPMIRWLERQGYSIKYVASKDVDETGAVLANSQVFVSSGHDEYWSDGMRANVEAFRDAGGHLLFFSGNEVFWRIRFSEDRQTVWCYKDTMPGPGGHVAGTPLDPVSWTGTWKDTRWPGRRPENLLTGTDFRMNAMGNKTSVFEQNATYADHPVWRNSAIESGDVTVTGIVGFEADEMLPTRPNSTVLVSELYDIEDNRADDNGENYNGDGPLNWGVVAQRYPSGAVVVGFGTVQWAWALDGSHDHSGPGVSVALQQFTTNLFRDLGAAPVTPHSGITVSSPAALAEYGGPLGTATGAVGWAGEAVGGTGPQTGTATGAVSWGGGSAVGARTSRGDAAGAVGWAGSASTSAEHRGDAAGTWLIGVGAAAGARTPVATATGAVAWSSAAAGEVTRLGAAAGNVGWAGAAAGARPSFGDATGAVAWAGAAGSNTQPTGQAAGAVTWAGAAEGARDSLGQATGATSWAGGGVGVIDRGGSAAGAWTVTGAAYGRTPGLIAYELTVSGPFGSGYRVRGPFEGGVT